MTSEERTAWACGLLMAGIVGWSAGRVVPRGEKGPQTLAPEVPFQVLQSQIDDLKKRADEQAKFRCLNVQAQRFDMMILPGTLGK